MNERFSLHLSEAIAEARQAVEYSNRKHQVRSRHVALVDGCAPCIGPPLARMKKQSPHLRMNQPHPHRHREALGEAGETIRLANREHVASRIFQALRCAMHELAGERERLVSRGPTVDER